jgi:hypothetical protein
VIIDPVDLTVDRDVDVVREMGLTLKYAINTHCHAGTSHARSQKAAAGSNFCPENMFDLECASRVRLSQVVVTLCCERGRTSIFRIDGWGTDVLSLSAVSSLVQTISREAVYCTRRSVRPQASVPSQRTLSVQHKTVSLVLNKVDPPA